MCISVKTWGTSFVRVGEEKYIFQNLKKRSLPAAPFITVTQQRATPSVNFHFYITHAGMQRKQNKPPGRKKRGGTLSQRQN